MFRRSSILTVHLFILPVEARKVARWLWVRKGLGDKNTTYLKLTLPVTTVKLPVILPVNFMWIPHKSQTLFSCTMVYFIFGGYLALAVYSPSRRMAHGNTLNVFLAFDFVVQSNPAASSQSPSFVGQNLALPTLKPYGALLWILQGARVCIQKRITVVMRLTK